MGNWSLNVRGVGCHHNGKAYDVEQLTADFVERLRAAGHTVDDAVITCGSEVQVINRGPASVNKYPLKPDEE